MTTSNPTLRADCDAHGQAFGGIAFLATAKCMYNAGLSFVAESYVAYSQILII